MSTNRATATSAQESSIPLRLRQALPGLVILFLTIRVLGPVRDPDTFWHIAAGDWLRRSGTFAGPDPWSDSSENLWVLHEWLPQLALSGAHQVFGLAGVAWLHSLAVAVLAVTLWLACRRRASLLLSAVIMALAALAMGASLSPRPHLVTFVLTVVTVDTWLTMARDGRPRWWLVPLTWVWACSHGMWFIGPLIGAVALVGIACDKAVSRRSGRRLGLLCAASFLVAALTPAGPRLLLAPVQVSGYTQFVTEWLPASLSDYFFVAFLLLVTVVVLVWARGTRPVPWTQVLLTALALGLALRYARTVAVGTAVVVPVVAGTVQRVLPVRRERILRAEVALTSVLTVAALTAAALLAPARAEHPGLGPTALVPSLQALPSGTVVCNAYELGGWLLWGHPNIRPVIDGRTEIYSVEHVQSFLDFTMALPGWQEFPTQTSCSHALLSSDAAVVEALTAQLDWTEVEQGGDYVLLRAP